MCGTRIGVPIHLRTHGTHAFRGAPRGSNTLIAQARLVSGRLNSHYYVLLCHPPTPELPVAAVHENLTRNGRPTELEALEEQCHLHQRKWRTRH